MTEQIKYKVNPLEKIDQIDDPKVRELCRKTVEEAIRMTTEASSPQAISQRLAHIISLNISKLSQED